MTAVARPRPHVGTDEFSARSMPIISIDTHIWPRLVVALRVHRYSAWLAGAVRLGPARRGGRARVPSWALEAPLRETEGARSVGRRSVNWPTPRPGILESDDPAWDPVWRPCQEFGMPL